MNHVSLQRVKERFKRFQSSRKEFFSEILSVIPSPVAMPLFPCKMFVLPELLHIAIVPWSESLDNR